MITEIKEPNFKRFFLDVDVEKRSAVSRIPVMIIGNDSQESQLIITKKVLGGTHKTILVLHPDGTIEMDYLFDFGYMIPNEIWDVMNEDEQSKMAVLTYVQKNLLEPVILKVRETCYKLVRDINTEGGDNE